jgi:flagellar basal-body rod modification protein FlgD
VIDPTQPSGNSGTSDTSIANLQKRDNLGSEAFLQLLIIQLQNQDPTAPQSNTEFIAQLATFSQLEQLTSINRAVTTMSEFFGGTDDTGDSTNSGNSSGN